MRNSLIFFLIFLKKKFLSFSFFLFFLRQYLLKSTYDKAVEKRTFLPPILHIIFSIRAESHAQYASHCTKLFEDPATIAQVEEFVVSSQNFQTPNREFLCAAELFLNLAKFHKLIYFEKENDQDRIILLVELISYFRGFVLDTVTTAEDGNLTVMLERHKILLLHNIAISGTVSSTYIGSLLSKAARTSTISESCEFFKFSREKIIVFISHSSVVIDCLHVH